VGREYVYDSTFGRLKTSGMYGVGDLSSDSRACAASLLLLSSSSSAAGEKADGTVVDAAADGDQLRLLCVDFTLAGFFANGVAPVVVAASLWDPGDPQAVQLQQIYASWAAFYARYRRILTSPLSLHLSRPTSRSLEAVVHVDADAAAPVRALLAVVNPTGVAQAATVAVPLYYAGLAPGARVNVSTVSPANGSGTAAPVFIRTAVVGVQGAFTDVPVAVDVPARAYSLFILEVA
jgi:hypothetical protein